MSVAVRCGDIECERDAVDIFAIPPGAKIVSQVGGARGAGRFEICCETRYATHFRFLAFRLVCYLRENDDVMLPFFLQ